jgi:hypothetical protein
VFKKAGGKIDVLLGVNYRVKDARLGRWLLARCRRGALVRREESFWLGMGDGLASPGRGLLASPSRWLLTVCGGWLLAKL